MFRKANNGLQKKSGFLVWFFGIFKNLRIGIGGLCVKFESLSWVAVPFFFGVSSLSGVLPWDSLGQSKISAYLSVLLISGTVGTEKHKGVKIFKTNLKCPAVHEGNVGYPSHLSQIVPFREGFVIVPKVSQPVQRVFKTDGSRRHIFGTVILAVFHLGQVFLLLVDGMYKKLMVNYIRGLKNHDWLIR